MEDSGALGLAKTEACEYLRFIFNRSWFSEAGGVGRFVGMVMLILFQ